MTSNYREQPGHIICLVDDFQQCRSSEDNGDSNTKFLDDNCVSKNQRTINSAEDTNNEISERVLEGIQSQRIHKE